MVNNKSCGHFGEREIIKLVKCPNCGKKLMQLPPNYPLYDLQCTGCSFRVQIKTNNTKPKSEVFGAGWDIIEKVMKSGFITPPLIINFKWEEGNKKRQKIIFYPFIPKTNLKKRQLSSKARRPNYKMFNYVELDKLPHFVLYSR
jgi:DNA-directed RNA polymerase subunit RPC12/RpoP